MATREYGESKLVQLDVPIINFERIGYVVPSRGENIGGLRNILRSLRLNSEIIKIVVVSPYSVQIEEICREFHADLEVESRKGVYAAINQGVKHLSINCDFYGFVGDDDTLFEFSVKNLFNAFNQPNVGVVYGPISYVDQEGNLSFVNPAYRIAPKLLSWGPCLVPNVGTLIRIEVWEECGGYDESLRFAGDLDFWLRVPRRWRFRAIKFPVGTFCFDINSLTGGQLSESIKEASLVRRKHTPLFLRGIRSFYEPALIKTSESLRWYKKSREKSNS